MLVAFVERDGLARLILVLLTVTTLGCVSYSWGYYEGFHNAKVLAQLEIPPSSTNVAASTVAVHSHDPTQRKVQHTGTSKGSEGDHHIEDPGDSDKMDSGGKAKQPNSGLDYGLIHSSQGGAGGQKVRTRSVREGLHRSKLSGPLASKQQQTLHAEG